ncbi:zinc finger protein Rlf-like isoform X1 [Myxocyprinus asiaticus]|uniref:zinc finger protein Rlf-like isoform X1 n=2 Tax=Myxocyprinus asiaticus TaxID=70543 RepID=UPI00222372B8|nr:zinc finger protein Rlf-like isoform X1 [Myxocyprinus asiaticus]
MADENAEAELDWSGRASLLLDEDTFFAMEGLQATLQQLEAELRQQDLSEESSTEYCNNFCQALMHYAGSRNSVEHGLPLLEVYCLSINCFAAARPHLTADSPNVTLVLKRLALSCLELLLSVPHNEIPYEAWLQFHGSVQAAHEAMLQYGSTDLQALLNITGEGGAWNNPVLVSLLTGQPTEPDEVNAYLALEGEGFMEMRIKHLEKVGEVEKALILNKACANCSLLPNQATFRQTFVTQLCQQLPSEEAIIEISRIDGKDVLDIICNMDTEGDENTALILCTTYLTQQLQKESLYCTWELILLWSKLQRRIDESLESFLERCLQFGAIAKTIYPLLFLIRVIQTETMHLGLAVSVELCVKALQLPKQEDVDSKTMVCKMVACLLPEDLEMIRACQLTEFLLSPAQESFDVLKDLYTHPDQKYDEENAIIPNSLRCELLLALKAHWPFDPEFWDWKTLKRHCIRLLGLEPEEEVEDEAASEELYNLEAVLNEEAEEEGDKCEINGFSSNEQEQTEEKTVSTKEQKVLKKKAQGLKCQKYKFLCQICHKEVVESRICHHTKKHMENGVWRCPICLQEFKIRKEFVAHSKKHIKMPTKARHWKKKKVKKKVDQKKDFKENGFDDLEPGQIPLDPSLAMYYQSTHDPVVLEHILEQAASVPKNQEENDFITFDYINTYFKLQDRDVYQCPATGCSKNFKLFKYMGIHIKNEHDNDDPNLKHYLEMKDRREKCTFCRKTFMTGYHHRKHRRVHYGDHPFTCVVTGCGAHFNATNELLAHKHSHGYHLSYGCELKGCSFSYCDLGQLYHHEAQHFRDAAYTCTSPGCKQFFYSRREFLKHLATHNITFTEEDFERQRKMKRKLLLPNVKDDRGSESKAELENGVQKSGSSLSSQPSECKESKASLTCVAVCFDGKKFTCGLKRCGRTFTNTRELHKHLKIAHADKFNEEDQICKKKVQAKHLKTQTIEMHKNGQGNGSSTEESTQEKAVSPAAGSVYCDTTLLDTELGATLTEIMLGLSQLSLITPSTRYVRRNSQRTVSGSNTPLLTCLSTLNARSPAKATTNNTTELRTPVEGSDSKRPAKATTNNKTELRTPVEGRDSKRSAKATTNNKTELRTHVEGSGSKRLPSKTESPQTPDNIKESVLKYEPQSEILVKPPTKPYTCEAKTCQYQSVTSFDLIQHYITFHGCSLEEVNQMEVFQSQTLKPFKTLDDNVRDSVFEKDQPQNEFLVQPTTKPYTCEADNCHYQSVTSRALMQHYIKVHHYSEEKVKEMEVFRSQTFRPFQCHLCSKCYKNKKGLRVHYMQMHDITKAVVEQMSCSFKKKLGDEAPLLSSSKIKKRKKSQSSKMDEVKSQRRDACKWQPRCQKGNEQLWKKKLCRKNDKVKAKEKRQSSGILSSPQQVISETDANVNHSKNDGSGSHRLVAKENLSYILSKYNKHFTCTHKNCKAAFTNQKGLVGHLQFVHHSNCSQLCFPCEHNGCSKQFNHYSSLTSHYRRVHNLTKKEIPSKTSCNGNSKSIPKRQTATLEEPIPRYKCTYANCNESYHLNSSLLRHTSQFHWNQPLPNPVATAVNCEFIPSYKKHVFYRYCDPSDSLVVRLQSTPKKESNSGCQTKLIISPSSQFSKDSQKLTLKQSLRCCRKGQELHQSEKNFELIEETAEEEPAKVSIKPTSKTSGRFDLIFFRTHEEALQMCQDRCLPMAFPCMIQNCDSVVSSKRSLQRHYMRCHKVARKLLDDNKDKLFYTIEKLEEIIQKKSAVSAIPDLTQIPNGVLKMEYQAEPSTPGGPSLPMSLHSIKTDSKGQEVGEYSGEPLPDSNLLIAADDLLYGESSGHPAEPISEKSQSHEERSESSAPPLIRPPPLDLSPPSTLRIAVDESSFEPSSKDSYSKSINIPSSVSISVPTPTRQPLRWKNELSEAPTLVPHSPISMDPRTLNLAPRAFDITAYKPVGFESSFLSFIKEKEEEVNYDKQWTAVVPNPCLKPDLPRRRDCLRRNCSVKENNERGATISRSHRSQSPLRHLISKGECTSIQNLRLILERALRGFGDQAIKQLQFLKPVVVLERPKSSASIFDLLPSETKA